MKQKTVDVEEHLTALGWFLIFSFPIFYIINRFFIGINGYESLPLRLSVGSLGLILVVREYLPIKIKSLMPLIFYVTVIYAFPFFFFFMLFNNPTSNIWKINVSIGLFFLSFFLDWVEYIIFSFLGFFMAVL